MPWSPAPTWNCTGLHPRLPGHHADLVFHHGTDWDDLSREKAWLVELFASGGWTIALHEADDPGECSDISMGDRVVGALQCDLLLESVFVEFTTEAEFAAFRLHVESTSPAPIRTSPLARRVDLQIDLLGRANSSSRRSPDESPQRALGF